MRVSMRDPRRQKGVTLIELLVVIVVVGILASIAYPTYQEQVRRQRRADGKTALVNAAAILERCYTRFSAYNNAACDSGLGPSPDGHYVISAVGGVQAQSYVLAATPQGAQAKDTKCGVLRLTSTGVQGSQDADTDENACWDR